MQRVTIARSENEVQALADRWLGLPVEQVHADPAFFLEVVRSRPEVDHPYVVMIEEDGASQVLLAARREKIVLETRIGYRTVYRPTVRALTVVHGGLIAAAGNGGSMATLASAVDRSLRTGEADVVVLPSLPVDSPAFQAFSSLGGALRRGHFAETRVHRRLELPESFAAFLASRSKKVRTGIRYDSKKLLEAYGDELSVEAFRRPEDFNRIFTDIVPIAAATYQRALGASFDDSVERRALVSLALERGWFRAWVLYRNGTPISFWQGMVYGRTYHSGSTGYHPDYRKHRVGIYLLMKVIEELCADPGIDRLDFGLGDADYKRHFSTESWSERDLLIFAPTVRGVLRNGMRTAILGGAAAARRSLERFGVAEQLKTRWRRRLAARTTAAKAADRPRTRRGVSRSL